MGFVNEKDVRICDEDGKLLDLVNRTIDRERNIVLKRGKRFHKGRPEQEEIDQHADFLCLEGEDFKFYFEGIMSFSIADNGREDVSWNVQRIWDSEGVTGREEEIRGYLVEAITTFGVYYGKSNVNSITVGFGKYAKALTHGDFVEPVTTLEND